MKDIEEQLEDLREQIFAWLFSTQRAEILEYIKHLNEQNITVTSLLPELGIDVREYVRRQVVEKLQPVPFSKLALSDLLSLLVSLTKYNSQSVLATYSKDLEVSFSPTNESLSEWALNLLQFWNNFLYFSTAEHYLNCVIYLHSFQNIEYEQGLLAGLSVKMQTALTLLDISFEEHNFEPHSLNIDLREGLKEVLENLRIFPPEFISQHSAEIIDQNILVQLHDIGEVLDFLVIIDNLPEEERKVAPLEEQYWNSLRNKTELNLFVLAGEKQAVSSSDDIPDDGDTKLFTQLLSIVTVENIQSGTCQQALKQYVSKLTPQQRQHFLDIFTDFCQRSPEIEMLFCAVDVDYFLDQIRSQSLPGSKADFVNSLIDKVLPEFWPLTQKAMLMIASLY